MPNARVLLGMSGGVDSSAAALLLQQQGYDVVGFTLDMFSDAAMPWVKALAPTAQAAIAEAQAACKMIDIPHESMSAGELFEREVVRAFCDQYWTGKTPNPCVLCNPAVKFALMDRARERYDCEFLATGHYVQSGFDETTRRYWLGSATDTAKDQSYFLYALTQDILAHCLFPLGTLTKDEVRAIAGDAHFENAQKPESQDICFIPSGNHINFLLSTRGEIPQPGPIVDRAGNVLGEHEGLIKYTIGQRKGIGIAAAEPYYVFMKDEKANTLVVDFDENTKIETIHLQDVNYVSVDGVSEDERLFVKTNYRQEPRSARIEALSNETLNIIFDEPQRACAPGQAAVCYSNGRVLFGGTIS